VWPDWVYITFDFTSLDDNTTELTLSQEGVPNDQQKDCRLGWNEMFDKLEIYLNV
jgi:uncharacterized protein YndB with AHSA1/START domain